MQPPFDGVEVAVALVAALVWSLVGLALPAVNPPAGRFCRSVQATPAGASCRIQNQLAGGANVGSGTLIDVTSDGQRGLVLTCAHLFTDGTGQVAVEFPDGKRHGALLVAIDREADLAALEIARPMASTAQVHLQTPAACKLTACGFGPVGVFRCVAGPVLGYSDGPGQTSVRIGGAVRSGDSGGGVFDDHGRLVAVVWGESGGVTYASTGRPLSRFLQRVLGRRPPEGAASTPALGPTDPAACPNGRCPLVAGQPLSPPSNARPAPPRAGLYGSCDCAAALATIAARLAVMESLQGSTGPVADGGAARSPGSAAGVVAALATTLLGVSGPAGWGVVAASTVGGWAVGRLMKRRRLRGARRELREEEPTSNVTETSPSRLASHVSQEPAPVEATAAAVGAFPSKGGGGAVLVDEHAPIERDDREARELLRLSQLEGRDPLQDAVAGRLALDRLDAIAESDADPSEVAWADRLRRELRERFNEIAPTKFTIRNDEGSNDE
jgi:hypothetical protein